MSTCFIAVMFVAAIALLFLAPLPPVSDEAWGGGGAVGEVAFGLVVMTFPAVGILVVRRQPSNRIGWLLLGIGLVWGLTLLADNYATYGLVVNPGSLPGPAIVAALNEASWVPGLGLMGTFLILLYPDGHLPSPHWRPVAWLSAITIVLLTIAVDLLPGRLEESPVPTMQNPIAWGAAEPVLNGLMFVLFPLFPLCIVACAVGLVRRFRRSRGVERLQLKWLATAGAVVALLYLLAITSSMLDDFRLLPGLVTDSIVFLASASTMSFVLLPCAIGIAVLRYGLYEIDVVINRALVYAGLTALLAGVYLGSVLLFQLVLEPITQESDLAVAGSTLAVAGLFGPARRRIQRIVDRRFYRSRYDAVQ
ncbi:MAG: hypothetical protein H0V42_05530, partial [Nocardioidaceae bacterium]|nr:hypothetical protein [Nocardioidaceae bacterium]